ncbi:MAG: hypothetical protein OPY03_00070 [Nitrosopumilus sp.]|nr:hypothetical protein [Nitrosopumilus sp.]
MSHKISPDQEIGKYDVKSIQVEPDKLQDKLALLKGLSTLHKAYNEHFKFMNSQMNFIDEIESGQAYGSIPKDIVYPAKAIDRLHKVWSGGAYVELDKDPIRTNLINNYYIVFDEEDFDDYHEHYPLPPLEELSPLTHVNEEGDFLQMTEEIPNYLAYQGLSLYVINSQWWTPRYYSWEHIMESGKTTLTWGKPFFFSIIKQLRGLWNQQFNEIRAYDHEIIKATKMMGLKNNEFRVSTL